MNVADRIQSLRKSKGISQEELADKIGVSRQTVSKWESEHSVPDIDRIIALSDYFEVTSDYLLKGIESNKQAIEKPVNANIFTAVANAMNFIGLVLACAIWYQDQNSTAFSVGLVFMALGCMIFGIGLASGASDIEKAKRIFWISNIWILTFIPLSLLYNRLFTGFSAPYPVFGYGSLIAFFVFWLVYLMNCLCVVFVQMKILRRK